MTAPTGRSRVHGRSLLGVLIALALASSAGCSPGPASRPTPSSATVPSSAGTSPSPMRSSAASIAQPSGGTAAVPLLAFYYIWFDTTSWNRAKVDYPQLGRYSSDDPQILRTHIRLAKAAGIQGFIVSWKDTPTNDRRLQLLMTVAREEKFSLAMIYQGLDFDRKPLPVSRVAADFAHFRDTYAADPVFLRMGGKPLTIWSGTWAYSHADVATVTAAVRDRMLVLNTEKSVDGYQRIADVTDGDAYYWSSVNPDSNANHVSKLTAFGQAVHARGQYWIAPFAPGFDARLVGGAKIVERNGDQTLRTEYAAAVRSSPDGLGLISWNEFSENTYVEPSQKYGDLALRTLRELRGVPAPQPASAVDSSETATTPAGPRSSSTPWRSILLLAGFVGLLGLGGATAGLYLRRGQRTAGPQPDRGRRRAGDPPSAAIDRQDVHVSW